MVKKFFGYKIILAKIEKISCKTVFFSLGQKSFQYIAVAEPPG